MVSTLQSNGVPGNGATIMNIPAPCPCSIKEIYDVWETAVELQMPGGVDEVTGYQPQGRLLCTT